MSWEDWQALGTRRTGRARERHAPSGPCHVDNLPPDLLSRIFQFGFAQQTDSGVTDSDHDIACEAGQALEEAASLPVFRPSRKTRLPPPFQIVVSLVCRDWHNVAILTPSLWTSITITVPTPDHVVARFLDRTQGLPIDVDCTTSSLEVHTMLLANVYRLRTLKMRFLWCECMDAFLEAASKPSVPAATKLTTFQLHLQLGLCDEPSRSIFQTYPPESYLTLFGGLAPRLERITLLAVHVDWGQRWMSSASNLTHLELGFHMDEPCPSWSQIVTILRGAPKLKKLALHGIEPWGVPLDPMSDGPIQLPNLTDIVLGDPANSCSLHLLRKLDIPALKSLALDFMFDDYHDIATQLANISVTDRFPDARPRSLLGGVEKFKIISLPFREEDVATLYSELRNLKSLNIDLHSFPQFFTLLATPCPLAGHTAWLSQLKTVYITNASGSGCVRMIREVLQARAKLGYPIKSLYLDRCHFADEKLKGLKKYVDEFAFYKELYATVR